MINHKPSRYGKNYFALMSIIIECEKEINKNKVFLIVCLNYDRAKSFFDWTLSYFSHSGAPHLRAHPDERELSFQFYKDDSKENLGKMVISYPDEIRAVSSVELDIRLNEFGQIVRAD